MYQHVDNKCFEATAKAICIPINAQLSSRHTYLPMMVLDVDYYYLTRELLKLVITSSVNY